MRKKYLGIVGMVMLILLGACSGACVAEEFGWPTPGNTYLTTIYTYSSGNWHSCRYWYGGKPAGIDIAVSTGTEIFAPAAGTVQNLYYQSGGFGNHFEILHDNGTITLYAHLSEYKVQNGQRVNRGDLIALSGSTGNSTGSHLHYEMSDRDTYQYYQTNGYRDPREMDDNSSARDKVVEHARNILNYTWTANNYILVYYNLYNPSYKDDGSIHFAYAIPVVAKGTIRGIPYTLSSNGGGGQEKTFEQYKSLTQSQKTAVSRIYTYSPGSDTFDGIRISMKYGMSCATFVTDCIRQGLSGATVQHLTNFHTASGYSGKVTQGTRDSSGYSNLKKGDYLMNSGHVMLVVENYSSSLKVIEQTPPDFGSLQTVYDISIGDLPGIYCGSLCNGDNVGTREKDYSYSTLQSYGYYPMYVAYDGLIEEDRSGINPGLQRLTSGSYAKTFTLTSGHYDVYTDSSLSTKYSNNYTGYEEEDKITYVGRNSSGIIYAQVKIPTDSNGEKTVYVNLHDVFVPGSVNEEARTAVAKSEALYKRKNSGQNSNYWIDPGDSVYLLTKEDGWTQVMYPISGVGYWRIAWTTESEYKRFMGIEDAQPPTITTPTITTSSLPDAYIGKSYSATLTATGTTPITYECNGAIAMSYGFLLDGKNFVYTSTNGLINGTITNPTSHSTPFTVNINVTASNGGGSDTKTLPVTIYDLPSISYTFKDSKTGQSYSDYVTVSGGKSSYTWTKQSGSFPDGLSMSSSGSSLYLKGTPSKAGTYNFSLKVKDVNGKTATKSFTITITPSATAPSITTTSLPDGIAGESYSVPLSATGTEPITWSATGLPSGLSCSSSGTITGTPSSAGTYSVRITASNTAGSVSKTLSLTIRQRATAPTIITTSLPDGGVGLPDGRVSEPYSVTLSATGTTPITWSATGLPPGLSCSSSGTISGTPTTSVTFSVTVTAKNTAGSTSKTLIITIMRRATAPTITTSSLSDGYKGESYSVPLSATGTEPITWSATGLPSGLSCSSSGTISGTPTASGTFSVTVTATNAAGSVSMTMNLIIRRETETPGYEISNPKPEFMLQSLVLSGQIGVNLFMKLPEIDGVDYTDGKTCYMEFEINGKNPVPPQPFDEEFKLVQGNETYYGFRCYINSVQMADTIKATFHYGDNMIVSKNCSVKRYIDTVLGMNIYSGETADLMKALQDYGHYVQPMLASYNHWTIGIDHAEMDCAKVYSDSDIEEARLAVGKYAVSIKGDRAKAGIASMSNFLRLDSETTISITITPSSSYSGGVSAVLNGGSENLAVKQPNGDYLIQIAGISAHKLGDTYTLTIRAQDTIELKVSALSYVNTVLNWDGSSADMKKAVTALYRYYAATMAYRATL